MKQALATFLLFLACLLGLAGSASAHSMLESSEPPRGAELKEAPVRVTFTFDEPVEASLGAVRVFDTGGNQVEESGLERPGGDAETIAAELPPNLPDGLYTATYRVVSADAHPVTGGITFTVGEPKANSRFAAGKTISELLSASDTGKVTEVGFWFIRWIGYLAIALAIGALVWLLFAWRGAGSTAESERALFARFRRLLLAAVSAGLLASLLAIPFQGAIAAGTGFWDAFGSGISGEVIQTRFGTMMLIRSAAWLALIPLLLAPARRLTSLSVEPVIASLAAVALAVTPALAGHAATRDPGWLLMPADILHVAAMAAWAGGLFAMVFLLPAATRKIASPADRTGLLTRVTWKFSTLAIVAVIVVGVTGAVQAIIDVGSIPDLLGTAFGRAVAIKIVLFAVLVVLGWLNRGRIIPTLVKRMESGESPGNPGRRLNRLLRAEVFLIVCVLGVSAALVTYPPPDSIKSGPVSGSVLAEPYQVEYTVDPARVGRNEVHLYVFDDVTGAPVPVVAVELSFSLPKSGIDPIEAETSKAGPGHYVVPAAMFGIRGDWQAEAGIRVSAFEEREVKFEVEIR